MGTSSSVLCPLPVPSSNHPPALAAETVKGHTPRSAMMASTHAFIPVMIGPSSSGTWCGLVH